MKRGIKITLISLAGGVAVAFLIFHLIDRAQQQFFSPPGEPRSWAADQFRETFFPSPSGSLPDLKSFPFPPISVTRTTTEVLVEFESPDAVNLREYHEVFFPENDKKNEVLLPTGNRLRLEAVALILPSEIPGEKKYTQVEPEWLDPETLEPLPPERAARWEEKQYIDRQEPKLFLGISNTGSDTPIRWHGASVFDERTQLRVQDSCMFHSRRKDAHYRLDLEIWHQTPLRLEVPFAFGDPEWRDLKVEENAEVRFGDLALAKILAVLPSRSIGSSSSVSGAGSTTEITSEFDFSPTKPPGMEQGIVLQLWPPHQEKMIDLLITKKKGEDDFRDAWGNWGTSDVDLPASDKLKGLRVRRLPKLGRAVFLLPRLPKFPEVDNLFETPIPEVHVRSASAMRDLITKAGGVEWDAWQADLPNMSHYPLVLKDTTPLLVLKQLENLIGRPLYFHRKDLAIRTEPAKGILTRLKEWWMKNKPKWMP